MGEVREEMILVPTPDSGGVFDRYNTTTVNQSLGLPGMFSTFTAPQLRIIRTLTITASIASIIAGIIGLQLVTFIDKRRKVFRHHMLLLLVIFDLLKAIVLLVYPVVILVRNSVYATPTFFNTVGWLTAYAIEGADIVIVLFAIHFALLIFKPTWKWVNVTTGNVEGGFYQWRRFMYPLAGILPMILASLAFINYNKLHKYRANNPKIVQDNNNFLFPLKPHVGGYKPMSAWCYLPPYPYWYKVVLSWAPRYIIFISICGIYISIYVYVTRESQKIKRELGEFHTPAAAPSLSTVHLDNNSTTASKLVFAIKRVAMLFGVTSFIHNIRIFLLLSVDDSERDNIDGTSGSDSEPYAHGLKSFTYGEKGHLSAGDRPMNTINLNGEQGPTLGNGTFLDYNTSSFEGCSQNCDDPRRIVMCNHATRPYTTGQINTCSQLPTKPTAVQHPSLSFNFNHRKSQSFNTPKSQQSNVFGADFKDVKQNLHSETYGEFQSRRIQIRKQLKSIFIYPFAYLILWIFPFILDCTQYHREIRSGPIVWLTYVASFMQPLSCVVDVLVLSYRETPWRYSWSSIERKELMDKYALKGELGERTIMELIRSRDGSRGWYYRGRWKKLQCWKYKPQRWKRVCWYIGRFFKGFFTNNYKFTDNCHDYMYWDDYYLAGKRPTLQSVSLEKNNDHNRDVLLSGSESSTYNNNRNGAYKCVIPSDINEVPLWWRIIHFHPMLRGIDLDELDRDLRLKSRQNDFVIPGLHLALQNARNNSNVGDAGQPPYNQNNNSHLMFGSDYTMDQVTMNGSTDFANCSKRSSVALPPTTTLNSAFNYPRLAANNDFSDATNCSIQSGRRNEQETPTSLDTESRKINILDFLND